MSILGFDFVQIGVDKAIEELIIPLGQLKEVMSLKLSLDTAIGSLETRLTYRAELRDKKVSPLILLFSYMQLRRYFHSNVIC